MRTLERLHCHCSQDEAHVTLWAAIFARKSCACESTGMLLSRKAIISAAPPCLVILGGAASTMASAAPLRVLLVSSLKISSCDLSRCGGLWKCSGIREDVARRLRDGGNWVGSVEHGSFGVARMMRGDNDVVVEEKAKEKEKEKDEDEEPLLLRMGVSLVTEILRLFSNFGSSLSATAIQEVEPSPGVVENQNVLDVLREDYDRAYFLTGDFTPALYADDCLFADPTIQFRGRDKYQRNLKLLVPFFEEPTLTLFDIQEENMKLGQEWSISANWNLRTYLRLPWKPLIDVDGSTLYVIDANSKIVKHIESWSISGRQAVQQLFVPSDRAFSRTKS